MSLASVAIGVLMIAGLSLSSSAVDSPDEGVGITVEIEERQIVGTPSPSPSPSTNPGDGIGGDGSGGDGGGGDGDGAGGGDGGVDEPTDPPADDSTDLPTTGAAYAVAGGLIALTLLAAGALMLAVRRFRAGLRVPPRPRS